MAKTKCKEKKSEKKQVKHPEFECKKCGEVAKNEKKLCKPARI